MKRVTRLWLAFRGLFGDMPAERLARKELRDAEIDLLSALTQQDYANALVSYHTNRIVRLKNYLEGKANQL